MFIPLLLLPALSGSSKSASRLSQDPSSSSSSLTPAPVPAVAPAEEEERAERALVDEAVEVVDLWERLGGDPARLPVLLLPLLLQLRSAVEWEVVLFLPEAWAAACFSSQVCGRGNLKSSSVSGLVIMFTRSDVTSVALVQNPTAPAGHI